MDILGHIARAFDTKGYPDDKNPKNWKTINGAHVHLDKNGNYDGGAGGKFHGKHHWGPGYKEKDKSATSIATILSGLAGKKAIAEKPKPAAPPTPPPKPKVTTEDLKSAWAKAVTERVRMKQARSEATHRKHAELLKKYIEEYEKLKGTAEPDIQKTHNPKVDKLKDFSESAYEPPTAKEAIATLGEVKTSETGKGTKDSPFDEWTPERRKKAKPKATAVEADKVLRKGTVDIWAKATKAQKTAAFEYSYSYKQFQEPLRGRIYGTSRDVPLEDMPWDTLGVGSMKKKHGEVKKYIQDLTALLDKCTLKEDMTLIRGCDRGAVTAMFGVSASELHSTSIEDLERRLIGRDGLDNGFFSCGSSEGSGFDDKDVIMHVACPAGTKALYMEPFAAYGGDAPYDAGAMYKIGEKPWQYWDGKSEQKKFGKQDETLLQRGGTYRCTGVKRKDGKLHLYIQVRSQDPFPIK